MPMIAWVVILAASVAAGVVFHERGDRWLRHGTPPKLPQPPPPQPQAQPPQGRHAATAVPKETSAVSSPDVIAAANARLVHATSQIPIALVQLEIARGTGNADTIANAQHAYDAALHEQEQALAAVRALTPPSAPPASPSPGVPPMPPAQPGQKAYGPSSVSYPINENDSAITRWRDPIALAMTPKRIPIDFAMAWQAIESGGKPCAIGSPGAKGPDGEPLELNLWQAYNPDDLTPLKMTGRELRAYCVPGTQSLSRAMTPAEIQRVMDLGVSMITHKRVSAELHLAANGISWPATGPDFWAAVKLPHAYPPIINTGMYQVTHKLGRAPTSWAEFRHVYEQIEPRARFNPAVREQSPYFRGLQNAEWVGFHVAPLAVS